MLRGEARDFLIAQAVAYHQRLKVMIFGKQLLEALAVLLSDLDQRGKLVYRGFHICRLVLVYLQRVAGIVARQYHAVAVEYQAAIGNDGNDGDAIAFRQGLVIIMAHQLQIGEAYQQDCQQHHNKADADDQPQLEVKDLALVIFKLNVLFHE